MRNIVFTLGCGLVAFLAGLLIYFYNKPRNLAAETGIPITATELYAQFTSDQLQANQAYLNKVLQVSGRVLNIKNSRYAGSTVVLYTGDPTCTVSCRFNKEHNLSVKPGDKITVKGICSGYFSDVVLTNGQLAN
ncbi:OB-fold protein [Longitalea arenae]|uniref:OB-fold protein n=1 Tax=Longitalea arenae TaxID=2812558 RepID=UPI0019671B6C|nr:hypothetical protein [Longitalea arenae]